MGGLILGVMEVGTGIILVVTDAVSPGVMITIGVWALTSGTLLIVEAIRARRRVRALLGPGEGLGLPPTAQETAEETDGQR
jgi:hypothetical protein